jgi:hypothetical protein
MLIGGTFHARAVDREGSEHPMSREMAEKIRDLTNATLGAALIGFAVDTVKYDYSWRDVLLGNFGSVGWLLLGATGIALYAKWRFLGYVLRPPMRPKRPHLQTGERLWVDARGVPQVRRTDEDLPTFRYAVLKDRGDRGPRYTVWDNTKGVSVAEYDTSEEASTHAEKLNGKA